MTRTSFQKGYVFPRKTANGVKYVIRYRVLNADGKAIHRAETIDTHRKKDAEAVLAERLKDVNNGTKHPILVSITFAEFVAKYWDGRMNRSLKASTQASHRANVKTHILPAFGSFKLAEISSLNVDDFLARKQEDGLSNKTLLNLYMLLHRMFNVALDLELISHNPVRRISRPVVHHREKPILSVSQIRSIIDTVPENFRALFVVLSMTGLRIGEVLGLKWRDVDFNRSTLHIRRSIWRGREQSPKTEGSVRSKPLTPGLALALERHRQLSLYRAPDDFVFANGAGKPIIADDLRKRVLYPAMKKAGILHELPRAYGFHIFRHSGGSKIHELTKDLKQAQTYLGHSSIGVTSDVYVHLPSGSETQAMSMLEQQIFPELCSTVLKSEVEASGGMTN